MTTSTAPTNEDLQADIRHLGVLVEQMSDQNKLILEAVGIMQEQVRHIPKILEDITSIKTDMQTVKQAVTATNIQVRDHEIRLTRLEAV